MFKLARTIVGLRFCSTVHGDAGYALAQVGTCPLDNIETRGTLAQDQKRERLRQWHIKSLSQLEEEGKTERAKGSRHNPKTDDDLGLRPALLFKMMMNGSHEEHALLGEVVAHDLNHDGKRLDNEKASDNERRRRQAIGAR